MTARGQQSLRSGQRWGLADDGGLGRGGGATALGDQWDVGE